MKQKKAKSFCITENIKDLVKYIAERDDYTKTAMYKRALRIFFEQGEGVSSRVLITDRKRSRLHSEEHTGSNIFRFGSG